MTQIKNYIDTNNNNELLESLKATGEALEKILSVTTTMNNQMGDLQKQQNKTDQRLDVLEYTSEITTRQAQNISKAVRRLARRLVGYPNYIYGVTCNDIYRYLREYYNLSTPVSTTEKQHYKTVIEGIESYEANCFDKQRLINHKKSLDEAKKLA